MDGTYHATEPSRQGRTIDRSRIPIAGAAAIGAALAGNIVVWAIARWALDISDDFMPLATIGPTIFITVLYMLVAVAVFWFVARRAGDPIRRWWQIATIALVLSFLPMLSLTQDDNATVGAAIALGVMHVVAYAAAVTILPAMTRSR